MTQYSSLNPIITTVKDRCRVCYTCVRECPAKALKIENGQAEVIADRCIICGNCVMVCSQEAKIFQKSIDVVQNILKSDVKSVACVAPSFPAEFNEFKNYKEFVGKLKSLGFDYVNEVAFGAEMVTKAYKKYSENRKETIITSDCPAIVYYIRQYHPELVKYLAPIVSPMVATARILQKKYGNDIKLVFIGPCIAKKAESEELDAMITFSELREVFDIQDIKIKVKESEFDQPISAKAAIFPVSKGLLQTMGKDEDIIEGTAISTSGRLNFREAIDEFEKGNLDIKHLELLCCEGCISGPGMSKNGKKLLRRTRISNYVSKKIKSLDLEEFEKNKKKYEALDYSTSFDTADRRKVKPSEKEIVKVLEQTGKKDIKDRLNCGACGYSTCVEFAIAVIEELAETEMCLPFTIEKLHESVSELNISNKNLAGAKKALKQSEKLASMGQLSAGIAHELNNPLGVITIYSNLLKEEIEKDSPFKNDLDLIVEQADRCKSIVGGLLNFARKSRINPIKCDIVEFVEHSLNSIIIPENIEIDLKTKITDMYLHIDYEQIMQVLTNVEKNAIEAMPNGGKLSINILGNENNVKIKISDTGTGISEENIDKIFTPFFTTKEAGKGTGLGLPISYGIVKMHKGKIEVISNNNPEKEETGTTFKIVIPRNST